MFIPENYSGKTQRNTKLSASMSSRNCEKNISSSYKNRLEDVKQEESDPLALDCDPCASSSSSLSSQSLHNNEELDIQMEVYLQCKYCQLNFLTYQNLENHMKFYCVVKIRTDSSSSSSLTIDLNQNTKTEMEDYDLPRKKTKMTSNLIGKGTNRPPISATYLAILALKNAKDNKLSAEKIYRFIASNFPYYQQPYNKLEELEQGNWKRNLNADLKQCDYVKKVTNINFVRGKHSRISSHNPRLLWALEPNKIDEMDKQLKSLIKQNRTQIIKTMAYPEHFNFMMNGQLDKMINEDDNEEAQEKRTAAMIANFFAKSKKVTQPLHGLPNICKHKPLDISKPPPFNPSIQDVKRPVPDLIRISEPSTSTVPKITQNNLPITFLSPMFKK